MSMYTTNTPDTTWDLIKDRGSKITSDAFILETVSCIHKAIQKAKEGYPRDTSNLWSSLLAIESRMSSFSHPMNKDKIAKTELLEHLAALTFSYIQAVDATVALVASGLLDIDINAADEEQPTAPVLSQKAGNVIDMQARRHCTREELEEAEKRTLEMLRRPLPKLKIEEEDSPNIPDFVGSGNQLLDVKTIPIDLLPGESLMAAIARVLQEHL